MIKVAFMCVTKIPKWEHVHVTIAQNHQNKEQWKITGGNNNQNFQHTFVQCLKQHADPERRNWFAKKTWQQNGVWLPNNNSDNAFMHLTKLHLIPANSWETTLPRTKKTFITCLTSKKCAFQPHMTNYNVDEMKQTARLKTTWTIACIAL